MTTLIPKYQLASTDVNRPYNEKIGETISIKDFGAIGDGSADDTVALQAARDYLADLATAGSELPTLLFPAGIYKYSVSPNWAINKISLQTEGEVRMRYTGTGNAFIIDGIGQAMYGLYFSRFIIEAPATAGHGVYIRVVQHSTFDFQVNGCGSTSAGIYVAFSVCSVFNSPKVSVNDGGWYLGAKPYYGMYLTNNVVGLDNGDCSYCTFINPIIEGTQQGIFCHSALGNTFIGGTSEGITDTALNVSAASRLNKFFTIDYEVNLGDVLCYGYENEFHGIDSNVYFAFMAGSRDNLIVGGRFNTLYLETGALDNTIVAARYNVYSGGSYSDNGTRTRASDLVNIQTNLHHNSLPSQIVAGPTSSPYSYTNQTGNNMMINVVGGTVTTLGITRNAVTNFTGELNGSVMLCPEDALVITYSAPPTLVFLNQ
jgi:hypothetical protein